MWDLLLRQVLDGCWGARVVGWWGREGTYSVYRHFLPSTDAGATGPASLPFYSRGRQTPTNSIKIPEWGKRVRE